MSSHCVLEQCWCGPEDAPGEKAEEEANIAHDVSVFPNVPLTSSFIKQHTGMYIYIYIELYR